jgi:hypothetical protein
MATGRAIWKLDDPATLRAEIEERARAAAEAAKKKVAGALERKVGEGAAFSLQNLASKES